MSKTNVAELLEFAQTLVRGAGKILRESQKTARVVNFKDRQDICTTADLAAEDYIWQAVTAKYPDHGITSEEKGGIRPNSPFQWTVDPLDGTKEYIRGLPLFNSSLILEQDGRSLVSAIYRPSEDVLYSAGFGLGAFVERDGTQLPMRVSTVTKLEDSFVYCYLPAYKGDKSGGLGLGGDPTYDLAYSQIATLGKTAYRVRALSDENTALSWLAQGSMEAFVNLAHANSARWHDIAPGLLIASEAGATITDLSSKPVTQKERTQIIVSNGIIHEQLIEVMKGKL
jgi:myo-inositol-1(or 4)-monophosphatase